MIPFLAILKTPLGGAGMAIAAAVVAGALIRWDAIRDGEVACVASHVLAAETAKLKAAEARLKAIEEDRIALKKQIAAREEDLDRSTEELSRVESDLKAFRDKMKADRDETDLVYRADDPWLRHKRMPTGSPKPGRGDPAAK